MKTVTVDFGRPAGTIKPMHATNNGPAGGTSRVGNYDAFKELGIPYMRNHDAAFFDNYGGNHTVDVLNIFPDFDADENDPQNYDFVLTDDYCVRCTETGGEVFYRLGSKIEHAIKKYQTFPPKDFEKYARISEHIIRHLTEGWADGLTLPITYWEIWNEADNYHEGRPNPCWQGTEEEFLRFYEVMARHLKKCFPHLKIGGPAYTHSYEGGGDSPEKFIRYMSEHDVPLDFFSYHLYHTDPLFFMDSERYTRALLDRYGFTRTETILDEWNYVIAWNGKELIESYHTNQNEKGAAFDAACMLAMQKTTLSMFMYYDFRPSAWCGPFDFATKEIRKPYWPFWDFGRLYRLGTEVASENNEDLYVVGARGEDQKAVLLSYYRDQDPGDADVEIRLSGLSERTAFSTYLTDRDHEHELIRKDVFSGEEGSICLRLRPYSVLFIRTEE